MKNIVLNYIADKEETIEDFLLSKGFSSNNIFHEIKAQNITVENQLIEGKNRLLNPGEKIQLKLNEETNELPLNNSPIDILFEDDFLLLVNKPKNLHVEPYKKDTNNNLASMVANYFFENKIPSKIHLVNRLDKCTSGIVIIAKNRYIKNLLCKTKITKKYRALVEGKTNQSRTIKISIDKEEFSNSRKISENGKLSTSKYETISYDEKNDISLVEIEILTGRTHQIRLSFSSIGHPLVGDELYGSKRKAEMSLHAFYTSFIHPITGKLIELIND